MLTKYLLTILAISTAECFVEDYRFVSEMNGYLQLHRYPEKWQDARLRCHLEGGLLASPTNPKEMSAMKEMLSKTNSKPDRIYTGIHATYSNGDFATLTGIPLSKMDLEWELREPSNLGDKQSCVILGNFGVLAGVDCETNHPFMCYKSIEKFAIHKCHPESTHSGKAMTRKHPYSQTLLDQNYRYDNRTGSCYKFHKESRSWHQAFKTCMAEDAYLAIINSNLESTIIQKLFDEYPAHNIPGDYHKDAASIGFSMWKEMEEWFTIHGESLEEAGFSKFNVGEPNNVDNNEWCGSVWRNGLLNDHNCDRLLTFICEKSPPHEETTDYEDQL